jgi:lipoic acid synthetase
MTTPLRKPPWLKVRIGARGDCDSVADKLAQSGLHTVCESALCPNRHECFGKGTATMMILGDVCTRDCGFCAVKAGAPGVVDDDEPRRVADAAAQMGLQHVVITSVTRDDLGDGGAGIFAATIRETRAALPDASIEVLTPDFQGLERDVDTVLAAGPDVFNHNIETVRRLQLEVRPSADYDRSLGVLSYAAGSRSSAAIKSGIMVGLGETDDELYATMNDLREAGCELLTVGQYLAPSRDHLPVQRYVEPAVFEEYAQRAKAMGFKAVASAPLVRSSYQAGNLLLTGSTGSTG